MSDTEIRERAAEYIDEALAEYEGEGELPAAEREAAIKRVEVASRQLADALGKQQAQPATR
jgi:hypothetical protein